MIINPKKVANKAVKPVSKENLQPNGIDLNIDRLFIVKDNGRLLKDRTILPDREEIKPPKAGWFHLKPNTTYDVIFKQWVKVPKNTVANIYTRSSLNRMGGFIHSGLYDSGFDNIIGAILRTTSKIVIEKGARIAQIVFTKAEQSHKYNGQYQAKKFDRVKSKRKKP